MSISGMIRTTDGYDFVELLKEKGIEIGTKVICNTNLGVVTEIHPTSDIITVFYVLENRSEDILCLHDHGDWKLKFWTTTFEKYINVIDGAEFNEALMTVIEAKQLAINAIVDTLTSAVNEENRLESLLEK